MIYAFDLDGTICTTTKNGNYEEAKPYKLMVEVINKLHWEGHKILIYTARGRYSGTDRSDLTKKQLREWGVNYDELHSKPGADIYIDDLAIHPDQFLKDFLWENRKRRSLDD